MKKDDLAESSVLYLIDDQRHYFSTSLRINISGYNNICVKTEILYMDTVHCTLYTVCTALINHMYRLNIHTESQNGRQYSFVFKFAHNNPFALNYRRQ